MADTDITTDTADLLWLVMTNISWDGMALRLPFGDIPLSGPMASAYFAPIYLTEEEARKHFPNSTLICVRRGHGTAGQ